MSYVLHLLSQGASWRTINYYGRFYKSMLYPVFRHLNDTLVRWAMRKYKRLRRRPKAAWELVAAAKQRQLSLFAHWPAHTQPLAG
ncbi:MAG: group II intron maturase-specific domain-containing protein [Solirubrobacteraceae bacterium]